MSRKFTFRDTLRKMQNSSVPVQVFIVGIGRSGTTLLTTYLNKHQNVLAIPEVPFYSFFHAIKKSGKKISREEIDAYLNCQKQLHPDEFEAICGSIEDNHIAHSMSLLDAYYQFSKSYLNPAAKNNIQFHIDKNPTYSLHLELLIKEFPDAKFIWMVRDYRDNVLSRLRLPFKRIGNPIYHAWRWKLYFNNIYPIFKKHRDKFLLLRYEDFCVQPEIELTRINEFIGIKGTSYEDSPMYFENVQATIDKQHIAYRTKRYQALKENIHSNRVFAWKKELSKDQIENIETICGKSGILVDYPISFNPSIFKRIFIFFKFFKSYLRALWMVRKEKILIRISPEKKLKKLQKKLEKINKS